MKRLPQHLRDERDSIVEQWMRLCACETPSSGLSKAAKADHMPELIAALAEAIERDDFSFHGLREMPKRHAEQRWNEQFELADVVTEYRLLRCVILCGYLPVWAETLARPGSAADAHRPLVALDECIDRAIADAVEHYDVQRQRSRQFLVGIVSHDLQNPLNNVLLNAELALRFEEHLPEHIVRCMLRIRSSGHLMLRLVRDLLDLAALRNGRILAVTRAQVNLDAIARQAVDEMAALHPDREITYEGAHGVGTIGQWDADRLRQVLGNLLANALTHGSDPVTVHIDGDDAHIAVHVRNSGVIPEEMKQRMFRPFESGVESIGTGLGLFISREIARAHGGTVELEEHGEGQTSFKLTLTRGEE